VSQRILTVHGLSFNLFGCKVGFWIRANNSSYDLFRFLQNGSDELSRMRLASAKTGNIV
jgi:hypothetical protein